MSTRKTTIEVRTGHFADDGRTPYARLVDIVTRWEGLVPGEPWRDDDDQNQWLDQEHNAEVRRRAGEVMDEAEECEP